MKSSAVRWETSLRRHARSQKMGVRPEEKAALLAKKHDRRRGAHQNPEFRSGTKVPNWRK
jgi:hypothetical protein